MAEKVNSEPDWSARPMVFFSQQLLFPPFFVCFLLNVFCFEKGLYPKRRFFHLSSDQDFFITQVFPQDLYIIVFN